MTGQTNKPKITARQRELLYRIAGDATAAKAAFLEVKAAMDATRPKK